MTKIHIETDQEYLGRKYDMEKRAIAQWILEECDTPLAEIEWLLDIGYAEGSYERFKDTYDDVLNLETVVKTINKLIKEDNND